MKALFSLIKIRWFVIIGLLFLNSFENHAQGISYGFSSDTVEINGNSMEIKRDNLPSGIYFYRVTNNKQPVANGKLIIQ